MSRFALATRVPSRRRFDKAIAESKRDLEGDPLLLVYIRFLGLCFCFARRYEEAIAEYREALDLDPKSASIQESLAEAYQLSAGHGDEVVEWQRRTLLAGDHVPESALRNPSTEADFARSKLDRMNESVKTGGYVPAIDFARAYLRLGQRERAFHRVDTTSQCNQRNQTGDSQYTNTKGAADRDRSHSSTLLKGPDRCDCHMTPFCSS